LSFSRLRNVATSFFQGAISQIDLEMLRIDRHRFGRYVKIDADAEADAVCWKPGSGVGSPQSRFFAKMPANPFR
jgi:hypothetical protein